MGGSTPCKIVTILVGDNPQCSKDIETSLKLGIPVIVLEGSELSNILAPDPENEKNKRLKPNEKQFMETLGKS
jgi:hypothetical protein